MNSNETQYLLQMTHENTETKIPAKHTLRHLDFDFGRLLVYGDGPVRDSFGHNLDMPDQVFKAANELLTAIYEQTGEYPEITVFDSREIKI